jgi:hypothetical protein
MHRTMHRFVRVEEAVLIGLGCLLVFLMAGCGTLDQGPEAETIAESGLAAGSGNGQELFGPDDRASGQNGFFPLDIGNRWTYAGEITIAIDGGLPSVIETREERSLIGTEERFGREYVLEERFDIDEDGDTLSPFWFRYRQDRAGLYGADIAANEPPLDGFAKASYVAGAVGSRSERMAGLWNRISRTVRAEDRDAYYRGWEALCLKLRAIESATGMRARPTTVSQGPPGGVLPEEIALLKYPLHPSQEWTARDDPFYVFCAVLCHELLDLTPGRMNGWKIEIDNTLFGPDDWAHVWYGREGFLGQAAHLEAQVLETNGNPMGTMVYDEHYFLESLDLVGKGRW